MRRNFIFGITALFVLLTLSASEVLTPSVFSYTESSSHGIKDRRPGIENGEYIGSALDYENEPIKVKVFINDGSIEELEIIESKEDGYVYMASGLIPLILELQSTEVDAVSGATISSKALIDAIEDALNAGKRKP